MDQDGWKGSRHRAAAPPPPPPPSAPVVQALLLPASCSALPLCVTRLGRQHPVLRPLAKPADSSRAGAVGDARPRTGEARVVVAAAAVAHPKPVLIRPDRARPRRRRVHAACWASGGAATLPRCLRSLWAPPPRHPCPSGAPALGTASGQLACRWHPTAACGVASEDRSAWCWGAIGVPVPALVPGNVSWGGVAVERERACGVTADWEAGAAWADGRLRAELQPQLRSRGGVHLVRPRCQPICPPAHCPRPSSLLPPCVAYCWGPEMELQPVDLGGAALAAL